MSKPQRSTRQKLASHSTAKVEVFTYYLGIYLNILGMAGMRRVHIYDLMCGEGQYADGRYGSALAGLRRVLAYFSEYPSHTLSIEYTLNDAGMSDVELGRRKIDRVKERADRLPFSEVISKGRFAIRYEAEAYQQATAGVIERTRALAEREKMLLFIDPWGYKDIEIADLRAALACGQSEVLLFLPVEMMYRFARKAYHEPFSGGEALHRWLTELFPERLPAFANVHDFINQFRRALQEKVQVPYSSRFTLETEDHNTYSLFYFTSSRRGLKSMLEAQWKHDQESGSGHKHRVEPTFTLFAPGEMTSYASRLERFLGSASTRTNEDLFEFGLTEGFLPKHTADVLRALSTQSRLRVLSLDGQTIRKNAFYLDSKYPRQVSFTLLSP